MTAGRDYCSLELSISLPTGGKSLAHPKHRSTCLPFFWSHRMLRRSLPWILGVLVVGIACATAPSAHAVKLYKEQFEAKYVHPDSHEQHDMALAVAVREAKCGVCHGKTKKERNTYGKEIAKLLPKRPDHATREEIRAALDKVATMKSNPQDPNSPTFGELLTSGKLPASVLKK